MNSPRSLRTASPCFQFTSVPPFAL
ncbi:TPA: hypothetical protein N0F65_002511 [Lagenidium giganteum]|uniref:Uncharacterized protein n=1 Tax=Lagenidium giganteum TaxID=4803 RepID=A0AAV2YVX3_9STRA|nr:TPA: hypothetical protein N0F65_002511 [Lagenidium giganteum]